MSPNILIKEIHDPDTQIGQINKKTLTTKEKKKPAINLSPRGNHSTLADFFTVALFFHKNESILLDDMLF